MHQQIPPVKALGHEYVAVRYRNRLSTLDEAPPWRIVGAVDGTTLTYDPPQTERADHARIKARWSSSTRRVRSS